VFGHKGFLRFTTTVVDLDQIHRPCTTAHHETSELASLRSSLNITEWRYSSRE
jgi:hypothetical protein